MCVVCGGGGTGGGFPVLLYFPSGCGDYFLPGVGSWDKWMNLFPIDRGEPAGVGNVGPDDIGIRFAPFAT